MNIKKIIVGIVLLFIFILTIEYNKLQLLLIIGLLTGIGELIYNYITYKKEIRLSIISIIILIFDIFFIKLDVIKINQLVSLILKSCINDASQEIFGRFLGRTKVTSISPNKTLEGYLGGYLVTLLLSNNSNLIQNTIIYILNIFGDLYFSYIKRKIGIKDYSHILLSHGGILDRLDSLIMLLFFYGIYYFYL
jgi:phosphatidate cytidylyltransferase